jgi:hypothetical protein
MGEYLDDRKPSVGTSPMLTSKGRDMDDPSYNPIWIFISCVILIGLIFFAPKNGSGGDGGTLGSDGDGGGDGGGD